MEELKRQYRGRLHRAEHDDLAELTQMSAWKRRRIRLLAGHLSYGIHEMLPQPARYFTILRHPADRAISLYNYTRATPSNGQHRRAMTSTLLEFSESRKLARNDNMQTRMMAGGMAIGQQPLDRPVTIDDYERAVTNLQGFAYVGTTDDYEESLADMSRLFGWRNTRPVRLNTSSGPTVDCAVRDRLAALNEFDLALYERLASPQL